MSMNRSRGQMMLAAAKNPHSATKPNQAEQFRSTYTPLAGWRKRSPSPSSNGKHGDPDDDDDDDADDPYAFRDVGTPGSAARQRPKRPALGGGGVSAASGARPASFLRCQSMYSRPPSCVSVLSRPEPRAAAVRLPAGMVNHGNTCYLNAVLQALNSLRCLVDDLMAPRLAALAPGGVVAALQACVREQGAAATDRPGGRAAAISPGGVRSAMGARNARWAGWRQEDAHEFLTELLDQMQGEVLAAEVAARTTPVEGPTPRRPRVRLSTTCCPASRTFLGCMEHELRCPACGHTTMVKEQFTALSLDLPGEDPPWPTPPHGVQELLEAFFGEDSVDKACEGCGAASVRHAVRHAVRRLPRVLCVHLKRFQIEEVPGAGVACRKQRTRVAIPERMRLGGLCAPGSAAPALLTELVPQVALRRLAAGGGAGAALEDEQENAGGGRNADPSAPQRLPQPQQQQRQLQPSAPAHLPGCAAQQQGAGGSARGEAAAPKVFARLKPQGPGGGHTSLPGDLFHGRGNGGAAQGGTPWRARPVGAGLPATPLRACTPSAPLHDPTRALDEEEAQLQAAIAASIRDLERQQGGGAAACQAGGGGTPQPASQATPQAPVPSSQRSCAATGGGASAVSAGAALDTWFAFSDGAHARGGVAGAGARPAAPPLPFAAGSGGGAGAAAQATAAASLAAAPGSRGEEEAMLQQALAESLALLEEQRRAQADASGAAAGGGGDGTDANMVVLVEEGDEDSPGAREPRPVREGAVHALSAPPPLLCEDSDAGSDAECDPAASPLVAPAPKPRSSCAAEVAPAQALTPIPALVDVGNTLAQDSTPGARRGGDAGVTAGGERGRSTGAAGAAKEPERQAPKVLQACLAEYALAAVVRHKGPLATSGHFVADVLQQAQGGGQRQWYHYDDSFVLPTSLSTVRSDSQADGYLCFFVNTAIGGAGADTAGAARV